MFPWRFYVNKKEQRFLLSSRPTVKPAKSDLAFESCAFDYKFKPLLYFQREWKLHAGKKKARNNIRIRQMFREQKFHAFLGLWNNFRPLWIIQNGCSRQTVFFCRGKRYRVLLAAINVEINRYILKERAERERESERAFLYKLTDS